MTNRGSSKLAEIMTRIERVVVFRVARGYFFVMAVAAVAALVGGGVYLARGLAKAEVTRPSMPPRPGPRPPLDLAKIQAAASTHAVKAATTIDVKVTSGSGPSVPQEDEFDRLVKSLRALFPDPPYSWDNEVETICAIPSSFGCLQSGTRIKRAGVAGAISQVFKDMTKLEAMDYLSVLIRLLPSVPVEKRLEMVGPIIDAERRARDDYENVLKKYERDVREREEGYKTDVAINDAKHAQWKLLGAYALGAGFSTLIAVSLILAFLAIERQTRLLERLLAEREASGPRPAE